MPPIYSYYLKKKKCFPKIRIVYKYQYLFFFLKRKNHFFIYLKKKDLKNMILNREFLVINDDYTASIFI